MKKESAPSFSEVIKQYDLDKYPKDDYTQKIFNEFKKYGPKLMKIAYFEELQKQGTELQQDIKDLMAKKEKFKNLLNGLKHALDIYSTVNPIPDETKNVEKKEIKQKKKQEKKDKSLGNLIAQILSVGKLLKNIDKIEENPIKNKEELSIFLDIYEKLTELKENSENSLKNEAENIVNILMKISEKSQEEIELSGKKISYEKLIHDIAELYKNEEIVNKKFKVSLPKPIEKPITPPLQTPPPGLMNAENIPESKIMSPRTLEEEVELPPDPSKTLPIGLLVNPEETTSEEHKIEEIAKNEENTEEIHENIGGQRYYHKNYYRGYQGQRRRFFRRPQARGRGFVYVKRENS